MSQAQQKRWLTQPNSKLGRADLAAVLRKEGAWELLPEETRKSLYALLPPPQAGTAADHDPDVHPLKSPYKQYIEEEIRRWQEDLNDGKEVKKWREEAMRAGRDRAEGKWDVWKEQQKENDWGKLRDENVEARVKDQNKEGESEDSK